MPLPGPAGFRQPAEWAPHEAVWVAWPSAADLWEDDLAVAQAEHAAMCRAIAWAPEGGRAERLEVCVPDAAREHEARRALAGLNARFHRIPFGDVWLRDIAPIFVTRGAEVASVRCRFNGWGGKYVLPHDAEVAAAIQAADARAAFVLDAVLEGGAVEVDGEGTVLTTRQCLLNPNRNPALDQATIERLLCDTLGVERVLWLDRGLHNDHTDGHVDTLARFVAPGVVCCMAPADDDPHADVLDAIARDLAGMRDARGRRLVVERVPSPGRVEEEGFVHPASHVNFYIANHTVVVPTYGTGTAEAAVAAIGALFPGRRAVGCSARAILEGGGAFHCITQQVPAAAAGEGP